MYTTNPNPNNKRTLSKRSKPEGYQLGIDQTTNIGCTVVAQNVAYISFCCLTISIFMFLKTLPITYCNPVRSNSQHLK